MCSQYKQLIVSEVHTFCYTSRPTFILNYAPSYIWRRVTNCYPFWCSLLPRMVVSSWHLDGRTTNYCLPLQVTLRKWHLIGWQVKRRGKKCDSWPKYFWISSRVVSSLTCVRMDPVCNLDRRTVCGMWDVQFCSEFLLGNVRIVDYLTFGHGLFLLQFFHFFIHWSSHNVLESSLLNKKNWRCNTALSSASLHNYHNKSASTILCLYFFNFLMSRNL